MSEKQKPGTKRKQEADPNDDRPLNKVDSDTDKASEQPPERMPHEPLTCADCERILQIMDGWSQNCPPGGIQSLEIVTDLARKMGRIYDQCSINEKFKQKPEDG